MKSTWITHNGKKILYADYSDFEKEFQKLKAEVDYACSIMVRGEVPPENCAPCNWRFGIIKDT